MIKSDNSRRKFLRNSVGLIVPATVGLLTPDLVRAQLPLPEGMSKQAGGGGDPIALVNSIAANGGGTPDSGFTSGAVNMTGANLLVVSICHTRDSTVTDSVNGGTGWTKVIDGATNGAATFHDMWVNTNPSVSSSMTFTCSGVRNYPSLVAAGFSNCATTSPVDQSSSIISNDNAFTYTASTTILPNQNNSLIVIGAGINQTTAPPRSISAGLSIIDSLLSEDGTEAKIIDWILSTDSSEAMMGYMIQTTATWVLPKVSWTNARYSGGATVVIKPA